MLSSMKNMLALIIALSAICSAYALQCYHCESIRDPKCGEKFESQDDFKVDCARLQQQLPQSISQFGPFYIANATACVKRIYNYLPGQPRFQRSCFYGDLSHIGAGCASTSNSQSQMLLNCDVCTGEFCNNSNAIAPIGIATALFIGLARLLA